MTVSVVAHGLGNLGSVVNMLKRAGEEVRLVSSPEALLTSDRVLLPGVGAFDAGMSRLQELGLATALKEFAASGRPLFGICLGMQLLFDSSEEGVLGGLGLVAGNSQRFTGPLPVPHMGWNTLRPSQPHPLLEGLSDDSRFYFVHSYRVMPTHQSDELATTDYGGSFTSMVCAGNVMGAQFHPEKSHAFGMAILKNFARV